MPRHRSWLEARARSLAVSDRSIAVLVLSIPALIVFVIWPTEGRIIVRNVLGSALLVFWITIGTDLWGARHALDESLHAIVFGSLTGAYQFGPIVGFIFWAVIGIQRAGFSANRAGIISYSPWQAKRRKTDLEDDENPRGESSPQSPKPVIRNPPTGNLGLRLASSTAAQSYERQC